MTQIKGTFEGCREAPAPLKLNEVFISHADSTLNTARSRAVTVNVSLQSTGCLFSHSNGPEKTKGKTFPCYFSCIAMTHSLHFSHLVFPHLLLLSPSFVGSPTATQTSHHQAPFPVFLGWRLSDGGGQKAAFKALIALDPFNYILHFI